MSGDCGHERRTQTHDDDAETPHPPSPSPFALPIVITSRQQSLGPPPGYALLKRTSNLLTASGEPTSRALREALEHAQTTDPGRSASLVSESENTKVGEGTSSPPSSSSSASSLNLGVSSLRRTLTEVKRKSGLALKRSLSSRKRSFVNNNNSNPGNMDVKTKHGRSFSEVGRGSALAAGIGIFEEQHARRSATLPLSSDISEAPPPPSIDPEKTPPPAPTTQAEKSKAKPTKKMDAVGRVDADVKVPLLLQEGTPLTKVSAKKKKTVTFRIDPDQGYVLWESKKSGIIPIENIKEIRSGADARYYREQFQLSQEYEARWLTLVYIADGRYKTLHAVAPSPDVYHLWDRTLRALHTVRQELMSGLGHIETRQTVWEKRYWRGADEQRDDRLVFEEVEKMCRRLNLNFSREDLMRRFEEADSRRRGYLDFDDFRKFVRLLKERPELTRLYKRLVGEKGVFDFVVFESFVRVFQKSKASQQELEVMFRKHATPRSGLLPTPPPSDPSISSSARPAPVSEPVKQGALEAVPSTDNAMPRSSSSAPAESKDDTTPPTSSSTSSEPEPKPSPPQPQPALSDLTLLLEGFTNFLLSTDNSAFVDQNGKVWQDMTRPLSEYYISSSHNTYLVGHQLVGVSTIEGYIRALLHSCRSVEIDIYDGEYEPVIYHGKTFTSKVPLRDICQAIAKYAFVASPYPVIISAEVHCSLAQQDLVASIMRSVFGDTLVSAPPDNRPPITKLPSPEELRGRVLLKAKNLYVTEREGLREKKVTVDAESSESATSSSSSSEASASDSEPIARDVKVELKRTLSKARHVDAVREIREEIQKPIKEIKEELSKARNLYDRVRRKKSPSPTEGLLSPPKTPIQTSTAPHPTPSGVSETTSATTGTASAPGSIIPNTERDRSKVKMSLELLALLVYTVGVKCRGFNKKETYAPEHLFSLSERTANKVLKQSMLDLIKHNKTHLVRIYPNGTRLSSSNFEPHRYWAAGAQLVAINWQTFDLGYMINHSMFQRNGRAGYVLKPPALRDYSKELLAKRTNHILDLTIISAQQLPRRKDSEGREIITDSIVDPYVEVSIHVPDWAHSPYRPDSPSVSVFPADAPSTSASTSNTTPPAPSSPSPPPSIASPSPSSTSNTARTTTVRTGVIKNNGFNPVWEEPLSLPFDCVGEMFDLIFLRVAVRDERTDASDEPLAVYCVSLGSLKQGYRHLPLHDAQLSQYLFSTLFVHVNVRDV
ncbi:hypothetical protein ACEPAI_2672 [Sanghuangporus weigelae]